MARRWRGAVDSPWTLCCAGGERPRALALGRRVRQGSAPPRRQALERAAQHRRPCVHCRLWPEQSCEEDRAEQKLQRSQVDDSRV